jgi:hypothetical protein
MQDVMFVFKINEFMSSIPGYSLFLSEKLAKINRMKLVKEREREERNKKYIFIISHSFHWLDFFSSCFIRK